MSMGNEFAYCAFRGRDGRQWGKVQQEIGKYPEHGGTATFTKLVDIPELEEFGRQVLETAVVSLHFGAQVVPM